MPSTKLTTPGSEEGASVRLHKMLAHAGIASRRRAEELIERGHVTVNGEVVSEAGTKVDPRKDKVAVDGRKVALRPAHELTWVVVNKPRGVITSMEDEKGRKSVADLVPLARERRLLPVGRLDRDSAGLLLLTNDNEAINLLTHPSSGHTKVYKVVVENGLPSQTVLTGLAQGITLEGEDHKTGPIIVDVLDYFSERKEAVLQVRAA